MADPSAPAARPGALAFACRPATLRRSLTIAAVVGTLLTAINQGDVLLAGAVTAGVAAKCALNFVVPFLVATVSAVLNRPRTA